jgi:hypothetical protein
LNPSFDHFKNRLASPFAFRVFLLTKLPSAYFAGLQLQKLAVGEAVISVQYKWFNKNPFGSLYFAILSMAAEASTGLLGMSAVFKRKPSVSMLLGKIEGSFFKKALGKIVFTCSDGLTVQQAVDDAIATGESKLATCKSIGKNEMDEVVAAFICTWSFKARN